MHVAQPRAPTARQAPSAEGTHFVPVRQVAKLSQLQERHIIAWPCLLQIRKAPGERFIRLTVEVQEPTFLFLLGSTWPNDRAPDVMFYKLLPQAWQLVALAHSAASSFAATAMSDQDVLSQLVQCKGTDILPAAVTQPTLTAAALETVPVFSRPLVALIISLSAAARTDLSKLEMAVEIDGIRGKELDAMTNQQDAVPALMRSAILLLKLADLTPTTKGGQCAAYTLESVIDGVVSAFGGHVDAAAASINSKHEMQGSPPQQQQLGVVLVQLTMCTLRHMLSHSPDKPGQDSCHTAKTARPITCFKLLGLLVAWPPTQSITTSAICSKGNATAHH